VSDGGFAQSHGFERVLVTAAVTLKADIPLRRNI
jgi:hypothetical protein